jgi:hypothetical protein
MFLKKEMIQNYRTRGGNETINRKKLVNGITLVGIGILIFIVSLEISNYQTRYPQFEAIAFIVKIVSLLITGIGWILIVISLIQLEPKK